MRKSAHRDTAGHRGPVGLPSSGTVLGAVGAPLVHKAANCCSTCTPASAFDRGLHGATAKVIASRLVLAALANPTRYAIFRRVLDAPRPVRDIARDLPVSRPAVSQHLKVLREAGLVTCRRDGSQRLYSADPQPIGNLLSVLNAMWQEATQKGPPGGREGES